MENNEMKFFCGLDKESYSSFLHLSDGKLLTDDGCTFDIHKIILARKSEYFRKLFCRIDKDSTEYKIPGIHGNCLSDILCYIYTGNISITEKNINHLMVAGKYFLLNDILQKAKQSIEHIINVGNCLKIYNTAQMINAEDIAEESFKFIQMNFEEIMNRQHEDISHLTLESLKIILSNRNLKVYSERTIWQAIVDWIVEGIPFRLHHVPYLLMTLARKEVDENLALDILQHEIVVNNPSMKVLNEMIYTNNFTNNLDILLNFLTIISDDFPLMESYYYRIPENLCITSYANRQANVHENNLYVSYAEDINLWRKIGLVNFHPDFITVVGQNLYIFEMVFKICMKFDLCTLQWLPMESFRYCSYNACVVQIGGYIYILSELFIDLNNWTVQVYDTADDRWFDGVPLPNMCSGVAVNIGNRIYVVGTPDYNRMTTHVFDTITQQWYLLPPPKVYRSKFGLVAYHEKVYLIGGSTKESYTSSVEVFDPKTNHWEDLPDLPYVYSWTDAVVLKDRIIVYENICKDEDNTKSVYWDDTKECWEKTENTCPIKNFNLHQFCTIDDEETLKMITKRNRDPKVQFEKNLFD